MQQPEIANNWQTQASRNQQDLIEQLNSVWHQTIPVSEFMAIKIEYFDGEILLAGADLANNRNLHNTMFAGSIYTLATLTGWGWCYLALAKAKLAGDIVLANANIRYIRPIQQQVSARTRLEWTTGDLTRLQTRARAKLSLKVEILEADKLAAEFAGDYVIHAKNC